MALLATLLMVVPLLSAAPAAAVHEGDNTDISQHPFMAAIHRPDSVGNNQWENSCGAALIHEQWVLTAAHCLLNRSGEIYQPQGIRVTVGVDKPWSSADYREVTHISFNNRAIWEDRHADHASRSPYDIALVGLTDPVRGIAPIKMAIYEPSFHWRDGGQELKILGWGSIADALHEIRPASQLQSLQILVRDDRECWHEVQVGPREWLWEYGEVARNHFCVKANRRGLLWHKLGGARKGDSGGPVIGTFYDETVLYGIATHAPGLLYDSDGDQNYLGTIAVPIFRRWVDRTIAEHTDPGPGT